MAHQNIIFQQKVNQRGASEFRLKFGRQKALVFRKHMESGFFYVDLYDNRPGRVDRIGLGLDELDQLISVRAGMDSLKQCFHESLVEHQMKGGVSLRPPTPPVTGGRFGNQQQPTQQQPTSPTVNGVFISTQPTPPSLTPYITIERKLLSDQNTTNIFKRPASTGRDGHLSSAKIPKVSREAVYENVTPTEMEEVEISQDMYNKLFQSSMN